MCLLAEKAMPLGVIPSSNAGERERDRLAVEQRDDPANRADESRALRPGPNTSTAARKSRESPPAEFLPESRWRACPRTTCFAATYSPLGVLTTASFETGTPCFSAKLIAARVGSPPASNATDFGGPITSRVTSSCFSRTFLAMATSRRGAPNVSIDSSTVGSSTRPCVERCVASIALSSCDAFGIIPAGISSQPISKRKSASFRAISMHLQLARQAGFRCGRFMPQLRRQLRSPLAGRATRAPPAWPACARARSSRRAPSRKLRRARRAH